MLRGLAVEMRVQLHVELQCLTVDNTNASVTMSQPHLTVGVKNATDTRVGRESEVEDEFVRRTTEDEEVVARTTCHPHLQ